MRFVAVFTIFLATLALAACLLASGACREAPVSESTGPATDTRSPEARKAQADAHLVKADALFATYHIGPAQRELTAALAVDPTHKEARLRKAALLKNQANPAQAATLLDALVRDAPNDPRPRRLLGGVRVEQGRFDEAIQLFETLSLAERLAHPPTALAYARALDQVDRLQDAADTVASLLVTDPWFSDGYLHLAQIVARMGRDDWADVWVKRYRRDEPMRLGEYMARVMETDGRPAVAQYNRGLLEMNRGRLYPAMMLFNKALQIQPSYGAVYVAQGRLSARLERPGDLLPILKKLPPHGELYGLLAELYLAQERFDEAHRSFQQALTEQPDDPRWLTGLADVQAARAVTATDPLAAGRRRIRERMQGRGVNSTLDDLGQLARLFADHGKTDRARELAIFVADVAPGVPTVAQMLATICDRRADAFLRLHAYHQVLERAPDADAIRRALVEQYVDLRVRLDVADAEATQRLSTERTTDRLVLLARVQIAQDRADDARETLDNALILAPGHKEALALRRAAGPTPLSRPPSN